MGNLDLGIILITFVVFLFSTACHEAAHAWMANRWGDPTGKEAGQLTLNPVPHIKREPLGMIVMPLLVLFVSGGTSIMGWASTPVTPSRMRNVRWGDFWTSAAGPLMNLSLTIIFLVLLKVVLLGNVFGSFESGVREFLWTGVWLNVVLMVLNFLPIPPLDGSSMLENLLPENAAQAFRQLRPFGFFILLGIMYSGIFGAMVSPVLRFVQALI